MELARVPAVVSELAGDLAGQTAHLIDVVVLSVGDVEERTVAIERGRDVPHRPIAECLGLLEELLHELPRLGEDLDAVVHAIAHVDEVRHEADTVDGIAEVLVGRRLRVVRTAGAGERVPGRFARWLAIRAPITLHRPGRRRIEDGDPLVSVAIRDVQLVRVDVDVEVRGPLDVDQVAIACRGSGLADLKEERPVGREFEYLVVFALAAGGSAISGHPDVIVLVDEDAVLGVGPLTGGRLARLVVLVVRVLVRRTAPGAKQIAFAIELHDGRSRYAAFRPRGQPCAEGDGACLVVGQGAGPLDDPDVIVGVGRETTDLPDEPVVRQLLRPEGIDDVPRDSVVVAAVGPRGARQELPEAETEERYEDHAERGISNRFHQFPLLFQNQCVASQALPLFGTTSLGLVLLQIHRSARAFTHCAGGTGDSRSGAKRCQAVQACSSLLTPSRSSRIVSARSADA